VNPLAELVGRLGLLWLEHRPFSKEARARRKEKRAAKRANQQTTEGFEMIPQNTLRKTGIGIASFGPLLTVLLTFIGVGECTPEAVEMGCVGGAQIAGALTTLGGGVVYWIGRNRAEKAGK
jgi:hypothetical protein